MVTFSIETFEFFLLVMARISAFIFTAPFFSQKSIPRKTKAGFTIVIAFLVTQTIAYQPLEYNSTIEFGLLVLKEVVAGGLLGYSANICIMILAFAGNIIDIEIGFAMVQELNPNADIATTITGNLLTYGVMMIMLVTNMHLQILSAVLDTFELIPVGNVHVPVNIYKLIVEFIVQYFIISFRIVIPVFASILLTNVVLAVLAKVAPQMNLFVIGLQIKVIFGILILMVIVTLLPAVTDFIYNEMKTMMKMVVDDLS